MQDINVMAFMQMNEIRAKEKERDRERERGEEECFLIENDLTSVFTKCKK